MGGDEHLAQAVRLFAYVEQWGRDKPLRLQIVFDVLSRDLPRLTTSWSWLPISRILSKR